MKKSTKKRQLITPLSIYQLAKEKNQVALIKLMHNDEVKAWLCEHIETNPIRKLAMEGEYKSVLLLQKIFDKSFSYAEALYGFVHGDHQQQAKKFIKKFPKVFEDAQRFNVLEFSLSYFAPKGNTQAIRLIRQLFPIAGLTAIYIFGMQQFARYGYSELINEYYATGRLMATVGDKELNANDILVFKGFLEAGHLTSTESLLFCVTQLNNQSLRESIIKDALRDKLGWQEKPIENLQQRTDELSQQVNRLRKILPSYQNHYHMNHAQAFAWCFHKAALMTLYLGFSKTENITDIQQLIKDNLIVIIGQLASLSYNEACDLYNMMPKLIADFKTAAVVENNTTDKTTDVLKQLVNAPATFFSQTNNHKRHSDASMHRQNDNKQTRRKTI